MTAPSAANQSSGYGPRTYSWPPGSGADAEFTVISVTSAIKNGLPKPYLIGWAAKKAAECAVDDHEIVGAMLKKGDTTAAINHIKGSRFRDMNEKADRGTIVHAAVEAYVEGKPLTKEQVEQLLKESRVPLKMWKSTAGMIAGVMEFLWDAQPKVLHSEVTVYSRQHGYAGTTDLIVMMQIGESLVPVVVDFKTSAKVYDEVALQLAAYARADFVGGTDASELPLLETGEEIKYGVVIRPTPSGKYERVEFNLTDDVFNTFLGCLTVANGAESMKQARRPS